MIGLLITILSLGLIGLVGMAITRNNIFERTSIAPSGGVASGTLEAYGNQIWVSQGLKTALEDEVVNWRSDVTVEVTKTTAANVLADEADAEVDLATGLFVLTGGSGTVVGVARGGTAAGDTTILIALNQQA